MTDEIAVSGRFEGVDPEDVRQARFIEDTLHALQADCTVLKAVRGPAVTRYIVSLAPGTLLNAFLNAVDTLEFQLASGSLRVIAPIPGTNHIAIEVPHKQFDPVSFNGMLESPEMTRDPSPLLFALGETFGGEKIPCDLERMPHLLIAGEIGSGKTVCVHSIMCSLLRRDQPEQVRFILFDPTQVELDVYNGIPHLLCPVITEPKKAARALAWAVREMMTRYDMFRAQGVRNLAAYNKSVQGTGKELPYIVVIMESFDYLMEDCRDDAEESIRRLAVLASAAGIHLVLSTQNTSVDVLSGTIRSNIPSRIAFALSSKAQSRAILDTEGAEKLSGAGDMIYKPVGVSLIRVQGCYLSDEEVLGIAQRVSKGAESRFDPALFKFLESKGDAADE